MRGFIHVSSCENDDNACDMHSIKIDVNNNLFCKSNIRWELIQASKLTHK